MMKIELNQRQWNWVLHSIIEHLDSYTLPDDYEGELEIIYHKIQKQLNEVKE